MKQPKFPGTKRFLFSVLSGLATLLPMATHAQFTCTFTPASKTGSLGPSQAQINTAYAATSLNGQVTVAAGIQSWTVPATGIYLIDVAGSSGGATNVHAAGLGARMKGEFNLNSGDVIKVIAGQRGESNATTESGAGGGGTYVTSNGVLLIAAGGGGGATIDNDGLGGVTGTSATQDNPGYSAAGTSGNGGATCLAVSYSGGGGGGYNAGSAGNGLSVPTGGGGGLSFLNGGTGGAWNGPGDAQGGFGGGGGSDDSTTSGGGGGGYSGGAGGGQLLACSTGGTVNRSGGGGGGSYNTGANQVNAGGTNLGNGFAIFTSLCNVSVAGTSSLTCTGTTVTLTTNAIGNYAWSTGNTTSSVVVVSPTITTTYTVSGTGTVPSGCNASAAITITVNNTPTVSITSSTLSACLGQTVSLTATGANTYVWTGSTPTVTNGVAFSPAATTSYSVTGTNACGTASAAVTVTVSSLPVLVSASSNTICAATSVTLMAGGATTYTWMPGPSTQTNYIANPSVNTVYTVTGKTGNCQGVNTITITTKPTPTITISAPTTSICAGSTAVLTASGAVTYTWNAGLSSNTFIAVSPTITALYTVIGTNSVNCNASASQVIIVSASPVINVSASDPLVCPAGSSTLTASGNATIYAWGGTPGATMVVNPTTTTVYTVVATSAASCSTTTMVTVSVFDPVLSITSSTAVCRGVSVNLTASGMDTYQWSTGSGFSSINVTPTTTTTYSINTSSTQGAVTCSVSGAVTVSVNPNPTVTATSTRTDICKSESTLLEANGATTYTWLTTTPTESAAISVTPTADQVYTLTGTDANGCKGSGTLYIKVSACVGIAGNTYDVAGLEAYPNPSSGDVMISANQAIALKIINELGQPVRTIQLNAAHPSETVSGLASGVYFIMGKNENGSVNKKIIITK